MIKQLTKIENKIFELAKPYLLVMSNELHTKEVVRFCLQLQIEEGGDRQIVIAAAILHDVGWSQMPENLSIQMRIHNGDPGKIKIHEEMGTRIAEGVLKKVFHDKSKIEEVLMIIQGHDTRKHALSLNDKIVKDADKLSRFSKKFCYTWSRWGTGAAAKNLFGELEKGIKEWFFYRYPKKLLKKNYTSVYKKFEHRRTMLQHAYPDVH